MKRSIDQVDSTVGEGSSKKSAAVQDEEDNEPSGKMFLLTSQNRSMGRELARNKRTIAEARKELELMRRKSREMESLVSLIQRAWSQLDIDSSMLLDSLGDPEVNISDEGCSELLHRLIATGKQFLHTDPTHVESLPRLSADQWSSAEEIEREREQLHNQLKQQRDRSGSGNSSEGGGQGEMEDESGEGGGGDGEPRQQLDYLNEQYGGSVEENLAAHASFTLSLLERLCNAINDFAGGKLDIDTANAMSEIRELRAEKLLMIDRITKLTEDVINLSATMRGMENQKIRAERDLDRATLTIKELEQAGINTKSSAAEAASTTGNNNNNNNNNSATPGVGTTISGGGNSIEGEGSAAAGAGASATDPMSPSRVNNNNSVERELRRELLLLESQLSESETAKAKVEMTLTERLARPLQQTEMQVADMRNSMEELRQQAKQRVNGLMAENEALQEKIRNMELALSHLEAVSAARIEEVVTLTKKEIASIKAEKDSLKTALGDAQTDIQLAQQLKKQVAEYQTQEELWTGEVKKLQHQVTLLNETQSVLQSGLDQFRARELALEHTLEGKCFETKAALDAGDEKQNDGKAEGGEDEDTTAGKTPNDCILLMKQSQARMEDMQKELDNARSNINDLILEIEGVTSEEAKARAQGSSLLKQMSDSQEMQRVAMAENLQLNNQIESVKQAHQENDTKTEYAKIQVTQQESIITQLRAAEQSIRSECQTSKKSAAQLQVNWQEESQKLLESRQQLSDTEHSVKSALKRNQELQERCDDLTSQCEKERKTRMAMQKELSKLKSVKKEKAQQSSNASASSSSNGMTGGGKGTSGSSDDADMLEMTLGMLRCSVCKDRFKSAAITRCFHLFCRECIDKNLQNRSRKCPACGEKFGQDDVTNIYFN